jgi:predicted lipid-binding transport protein (Tim44 family)
MDLFTFYGGIKFDTSAEAHGLQIAHQMVVVQWQKNDAGELKRVVIAPAMSRLPIRSSSSGHRN